MDEPLAITVKRVWANGGRGLLIVGIAAIAVLILNVITMLWLWWPGGDFAPMYGSAYDAPQIVTGDVFKIGDKIPVGPVLKCNASDKPVTVTGARQWRRVDVSGTYIPDGSGSGLWSPKECRELTFANTMPEGITAGVWEIVGVERAFAGGESQEIGWITESFTVAE